MSADLQWLLLRKWNSFLVQKALPEGPILSREPGNMLNVHSQKLSGLANTKAIHVTTAPEGGLVIVTKDATQNPNKIAGNIKVTKLSPSTGARRAAKIAAGSTAGKGFRADLRQAAVARASTLVKVAHAEKSPKQSKGRAGRGKKEAASAPAADEE